MLPIPDEFDEIEIIVRSIFSKMVLKDPKKGIGVRANAFNPYPKEKGEISVNRLSFTTESFCKMWSKDINVDDEYVGLASLYCKCVYEKGASLQYTPLPNNLYHSDIMLGYNTDKGQPIPSIYNQIKTNISKIAKLHLDSSPDEIEWKQEEIIPNEKCIEDNG